MKISVAALTVVLSLGALAAQAQLEDLRVVSGDLLTARLNGKKVELKLAGIWVPTPPGMPKRAEYQGAEARDFVVETLQQEGFVVRGLSVPQPGKPIPVRILVGDGPGQDLAALLAEAGLALRTSSSPLTAQQKKDIRSAEGRARRAFAGLHNGGMQKFVESQKAQRDLGVEVYHPSQLRPGGTNVDTSTTSALEKELLERDMYIAYFPANKEDPP